MFHKKDALGKRLKDIRKERGLSTTELASLVGRSQSAVSKLENGQLRPSVEYVEVFCRALKLSAQLRSELLSLTKAFLYTFSRWAHDDHEYSSLQDVVRKHEAQSRLLRGFECVLIPGLLQTEDYARAIWAKSTQCTGPEIDKAVSLRMRRQQILSNKGKKVQLILMEQCLYTSFVAPSQMIVQLSKVLEVLDGGRVELRILPRDAALNLIPTCSFFIYDDRLVEIESNTSVFSYWDKEEVTKYIDLFQGLLAASEIGRAAKARVVKAKESFSARVR